MLTKFLQFDLPDFDARLVTILDNVLEYRLACWAKALVLCLLKAPDRICPGTIAVHIVVIITILNLEVMLRSNDVLARWSMLIRCNILRKIASDTWRTHGVVEHVLAHGVLELGGYFWFTDGYEDARNGCTIRNVIFVLRHEVLLILRHFLRGSYVPFICSILETSSICVFLSLTDSYGVAGFL